MGSLSGSDVIKALADLSFLRSLRHGKSLAGMGLIRSRIVRELWGCRRGERVCTPAGCFEAEWSGFAKTERSVGRLSSASGSLELRQRGLVTSILAEEYPCGSIRYCSRAWPKVFINRQIVLSDNKDSVFATISFGWYRSPQVPVVKRVNNKAELRFQSRATEVESFESDGDASGQITPDNLAWQPRDSWRAPTRVEGFIASMLPGCTTPISAPRDLFDWRPSVEADPLFSNSDALEEFAESERITILVATLWIGLFY
jgi:hypothetical protein